MVSRGFQIPIFVVVDGWGDVDVFEHGEGCRGCYTVFHTVSQLSFDPIGKEILFFDVDRILQGSVVCDADTFVPSLLADCMFALERIDALYIEGDIGDTKLYNTVA